MKNKIDVAATILLMELLLLEHEEGAEMMSLGMSLLIKRFLKNQDVLNEVKQHATYEKFKSLTQ